MDSADAARQDVASFDLGSTHRMPTISAAQALDDLGSGRSRFISTGIAALDEALAPLVSTHGQLHEPALSGLGTGQVAEIWGPPGSGKTALALQLAVNAVRTGQQVVWADGFHPIPGQRLKAIFEAAADHTELTGQAETSSASLDSLHHFMLPTLAHLIALLCKPTTTAIPKETSLVVIDSFSALVNHAYPRNLESKKPLKGPSASSKRAQAIQFIISSLQKLAAAKDLLVVIVSQCASRMQSDRGATIAPAVSSAVLDSGIGTRLVVFKDWIGHRESLQSLNLIGIQKANGTVFPEVISKVLPFEITMDGVANFQAGLHDDPNNLSSVAYHKRKLDDTGFEVANSEDEAYGWESDDETHMPRMPPQAQGSEDLLLGEGDNHESASEHGGSESELSSPPESDNDPVD